MVLLRIVILGDGGVGKSAMTMRFLGHEFIEDYDPTIENSYRRQFDIGTKQPIMLDILDTAGQEEFSAIREIYIRRGQGFIIVYSIALLESFEVVPDFRLSVLRAKGIDDHVGQYPIVLVGNKADQETERQVKTVEGEELARKWNSSFYETSARTGHNIHEVFADLVRSMLKVQQAEKDVKPSKEGSSPWDEKKRKCIMM
jgi:small GTP-binding protein